MKTWVPTGSLFLDSRYPVLVTMVLPFCLKIWFRWIFWQYFFWFIQKFRFIQCKNLNIDSKTYSSISFFGLLDRKHCNFNSCAKAEVECCEVMLQMLHNILGCTDSEFDSDECFEWTLSSSPGQAWCAITFLVITSWKAPFSGTTNPISWPLWAKIILSPKRTSLTINRHYKDTFWTLQYVDMHYAMNINYS